MQQLLREEIMSIASLLLVSMFAGLVVYVQHRRVSKLRSNMDKYIAPAIS